jgi:hypothetical protein
MHKAICAIRECKKENPECKRREKNEEIISRNCLPHHKTASTFINMHKAARLYLLRMLSRCYAMIESVQHDDSRDCKKENPDFERRKKNEEMISRNCLPTIREPAPSSTCTKQPHYICSQCCRDIIQ